MKTSNFSWVDSVYLRVKPDDYDLHNDYDFRKLSFDVSQRSIRLTWQRGAGEWVDKNLPREISITIEEVFQFEAKPRNPDLPFTEDDCLSSFGYISDEEWCEGQFWSDEKPDDSWLWSFEFQSGAEFIIGAKSAYACIEP